MPAADLRWPRSPPGRCVSPREKDEKTIPARPAHATPEKPCLEMPIRLNNYSRPPGVPETFPERQFRLPETSVPPKQDTGYPAKEAAPPRSARGSPRGLAGSGLAQTATAKKWQA